MSIQYPMIAAAKIYEAYSVVANHKNHPDAHPLDNDISSIARRKLGLETKEIQIVDDLNCGELSKSWSLKGIASPVVAVQKGLAEQAPTARKYLILKELHKAAGMGPWVDVALKVTSFFLTVSLINSGMGFFSLFPRVIGVGLVTSAVETLANSYFAGRAHEFAFNQFGDEGKKEIRTVYKAHGEITLEGESGDPASLKTYLASQPKEKFSALDLPFKLKPANTLSSFYHAREKHHLDGYEQKSGLMKLGSLVSSIFLALILKRAIGCETTLAVLMTLEQVTKPVAQYVGHYVDDKEFLKGRKAPKPIDATVWKGAL